jgi:hypothetical protein
MNIKFFLIAIILIASLASASAQSTKNGAAQLPEGCIIENGLLKAKQGFHFQLSADKKKATLVNAKNNISGTFNCHCSEGKDGNCSVLQSGEGIRCTGNCSCKILTVVSGGVKIGINLTTGEIKKI